MITLILRSLGLPLLCVLLITGATLLGKVLPGEGQILYTGLIDDTAYLWAFDVSHRISLALVSDVLTGTPLYPSPDGQRIAYFDDDSTLRIAHIDGTNIVSMNWIISQYTVSWMPNSREILTVRLAAPISIINVEDQTQTILQNRVEFACQSASFSPDGQRIAAVTAREVSDGVFFCGGGMALMDVRTDSNRIAVFGDDEPSGNFDAIWSPDSSHLVLYGVPGIYLVQDGDEIAVTPLLELSFASAFSIPTWSHDGTRLAFVFGRGQDIYVMPVLPEVGEIQQVTNTSLQEAYVTWSPDDQRLAFTSGRFTEVELYILDLATGETQQMTTNTFTELNPVWLP